MVRTGINAGDNEVTTEDTVRERFRQVWVALDELERIDATQRQREQMDTLLSYIRADIKLLLRARGLTVDHLGSLPLGDVGTEGDK
jgi:hypothetical protein